MGWWPGASRSPVSTAQPPRSVHPLASAVAPVILPAAQRSLQEGMRPAQVTHGALGRVGTLSQVCCPAPPRCRPCMPQHWIWLERGNWNAGCPGKGTGGPETRMSPPGDSLPYPKVKPSGEAVLSWGLGLRRTRTPCTASLPLILALRVGTAGPEKQNVPRNVLPHPRPAGMSVATCRARASQDMLAEPGWAAAAPRPHRAPVASVGPRRPFAQHACDSAVTVSPGG